MQLSFECRMKTDSGIERWNGIIPKVVNHGSHFEIGIESRSGITVVFGKTSNGGFACMPDYNTGCHLSNLKDKFWNTEKLTAVLGEVDGITVAQALYVLADKLGL
ncbi:DUF6618 family protein [Desulfitibacter alkalitolerans]|uniref:DUF6618 family protein n=1 Tax=Desulfitibacter alkalitolerans TaxID=264641 RepID=UPI000488C79C|nr:DUF6618 family protein [Desulfitibacter alkalitolerans]